MVVQQTTRRQRETRRCDAMRQRSVRNQYGNCSQVVEKNTIHNSIKGMNTEQIGNKFGCVHKLSVYRTDREALTCVVNTQKTDILLTPTTPHHTTPARSVSKEIHS